MNDSTPDDPLPALIAMIDQLVATAPQIARAARGLFDAFEAEGFGASQALYLTVTQLKDVPGPPPVG
jgi:hypothetical protein